MSISAGVELGSLGNFQETLIAETRVHKQNILQYMSDFKGTLKGKDPLISVLRYLNTQGNSAPLLSALLVLFVDTQHQQLSACFRPGHESTLPIGEG